MLRFLRKKKKIVLLSAIVSVLCIGLFITYNIAYGRENCCRNNDCGDYNTYEVQSIEIDEKDSSVNAHNWTWASTQDWCEGSGTEKDPYVIEKICIEGGSYPNYITIKNSDVFFEIKDCAIYDSNSSWAEESGIILENVENGKIIGNELSFGSESNGITLFLCKNCIVEKNTINENGINGIELINSDNNQLRENTINNNAWAGIKLYRSDKNEIRENTISDTGKYGVCIYQSKENNIYKNTITKSKEYAFYLFQTDQNDFNKNILMDNNKPVYKENCKNNEFRNNTQLSSSAIWTIIIMAALGGIASIILTIKFKNKKKGKKSEKYLNEKRN